jgi:hypothetical protein
VPSEVTLIHQGNCLQDVVPGRAVTAAAQPEGVSVLMLKRIWIITAFAAAMVASLGAPALAARSLPAASQAPHSSALATQRVSPAAGANCGEDFCDYLLPNFSGLCYGTNVSQSGLTGCRNRDESFGNTSSSTVRLFFSPSFGGASVCLPAGAQFSNLSGLKFNIGPGMAGFGQAIENNVASMTISSSKCLTPL